MSVSEIWTDDLLMTSIQGHSRGYLGSWPWDVPQQILELKTLNAREEPVFWILSTVATTNQNKYPGKKTVIVVSKRDSQLLEKLSHSKGMTV
jgi:hypothetical protein